MQFEMRKFNFTISMEQFARFGGFSWYCRRFFKIRLDRFWLDQEITILESRYSHRKSSSGKRYFILIDILIYIYIYICVYLELNVQVLDLRSDTNITYYLLLQIPAGTKASKKRLRNVSNKR